MRIQACLWATLLVVACGDDAATGGGGTGATSSGGGTTGGMNAGGNGNGGQNAGGDNTGGDNTGGTAMGGAGPNAGDCDTDDDCDAGATCEEVTPGGFRVCTTFPPEATTCMSVDDICCDSTQCKAGSCYNTGDLPYCGGAFPLEYNECFDDNCLDDSDCLQVEGGDNVCLPADVFGNPFRTCLAAYCRLDSDCTAEAGGICAPVDNPCCASPSGLACVYPSGCRSSNDCTDGYCDIDNGEGVCVPGAPACPA